LLASSSLARRFLAPSCPAAASTCFSSTSSPSCLDLLSLLCLPHECSPIER
jgi:hypothetical protein